MATMKNKPDSYLPQDDPQAEMHAQTIARLIQEGRMPSFEEFSQVMAEVKQSVYGKKHPAERKKPKQ